MQPEDRNKLQIITPLKSSSSLPQTPKRNYEQQQQQQQHHTQQQPIATAQEQQLLLQQQELQLFQQRKQHLFNRSYSSDCERNSSGSDVNNASIKRKHLTKTKKLQRSASETAATSPAITNVPTTKELTSTLKGSIKSRSSTRKHPANVKFSFDDNDANNNNNNVNHHLDQPDNGNVSDNSKKDDGQSTTQTIGNYDELPLLVSLKTRRSNSVCGVHQYATITEPFNRIPLPPRRNNSHENLFSTTLPYIDDDINHTYTTLQPQPYSVVTTAPTSVTSLHNERFITLHPQNVASVQTLAKNYFGKEPEKYVQQTSLYDVACPMATCYDMNGNGGNEPTTTTNTVTVTTTQSEQLPPAPHPPSKRNPSLGMMGKSFAIIQEEIEIPPENSHTFQFHMPAKGKICQVCHEPLLNEIRNVVKCGDCDLTCHGWCVSMIVVSFLFDLLSFSLCWWW